MSLDGHELAQIGQVLATVANEQAYGYDGDEDVILFHDEVRAVGYGSDRTLGEALVAELASAGYAIVKMKAEP